VLRRAAKKRREKEVECSEEGKKGGMVPYLMAASRTQLSIMKKKKVPVKSWRGDCDVGLSEKRSEQVPQSSTGKRRYLEKEKGRGCCFRRNELYERGGGKERERKTAHTSKKKGSTLGVDGTV